jgi:hypothetical protein
MYDDEDLAWQDAHESATDDQFVKWCKAHDIDFDDCGEVEQWEIRDDYFNWLTNEREDLSIFHGAY